MKTKIAVYGSGTIGACQATLTSGNGYPTVVIGHSEAGLNRCRAVISQNWDDLIKEGLAAPSNKAGAMALLTITNDPSALLDAVIASTTSSINADVLAGLLENPSRFLVAHPFQPVHMLPLVEVVCHEQTSDKTVQTVCALLAKLHREVVVLKKSRST